MEYFYPICTSNCQCTENQHQSLSASESNDSNQPKESFTIFWHGHDVIGSSDSLKVQKSVQDHTSPLERRILHFTPLHPAVRGSRAENKNLKTKKPKGQRINPIPQATPIHPERNELKNRLVGSRRTGLPVRVQCTETGTMRMNHPGSTTRNTRSSLHRRSFH